MLKVRLKARVIERRASPLARRPLKTRVKHRNCEGSSPRNSPPGATAPIREEEEASSRAAELLFSSPSLPNISLGRPHAHAHVPHAVHASHAAHAPHALHAPTSATVPVALPPVSEAEAYCPGVPAGAGGLSVSARLAKRPLGRTHSAPLPLGDPALQPPSAHHYLRDQIRKTTTDEPRELSREIVTMLLSCMWQVLTRAHDAAAAQLREEEGEVIDLTARRAAPVTSSPSAPHVGALGGAGGAGGAAEPAPLARALSSPLVGARAPATGLAYDALMLKHG
ncbi:hypothetical protein RR48_09370 [Papilio machaon]|uniref:Uncharacterized protein n=1 Tax=Papilio machaon TaxID=76193 RepID=A0A194RHL9_PAPMA|nr:hypothetical protein RR48_09370 [Papilio machaon]